MDANLAASAILETAFDLAQEMRMNTFSGPTQIRMHQDLKVTLLKWKDSEGRYMYPSTDFNQPLMLWGLPIVFSSEVLKGEVEVRDFNGRILGRVVNVGKETHAEN